LILLAFAENKQIETNTVMHPTRTAGPFGIDAATVYASIQLREVGRTHMDITTRRSAFGGTHEESGEEQGGGSDNDSIL
jgi:hypothetical protein